MTQRVLVVAHNHPDLHPGGTEIFAHDLFSEYRRRPDVEALFLAATNRVHREQRPGTNFQSVSDAPDEVVLWAGHFDTFNLSQIDTYGVMPGLAALLEDFRPDVVHIHHMLLIGAEFIPLVRRILPRARIVVTLHDYYAICAHDGLMMRTDGKGRCDRATPSRCHGCFPDIGADRFLLREHFIKTMFSHVDAFIAPSRFLKDRFVAWGLPAEAISVMANGRPPVEPAPHRAAPDGQRTVFGYFGNFNPWKGVDILLQAATQLAAEPLPGFEMRLHGAAPFQKESFVSRLDDLVGGAGASVVPLGPYGRGDVSSLMAAVDWVVVPSIWWENAPLVIQEAFIHHRPVIARGIGGMAESVRHGVDGLLVSSDGPGELARTMSHAARTPGLWQTLVDGIAAPDDIRLVAERHLAFYGGLSRASDDHPRRRAA